MTDRPWFRRRASGLGWTPNSWQGWLVIVFGAAAIAAPNLLVIARLAPPHP